MNRLYYIALFICALLCGCTADAVSNVVTSPDGRIAVSVDVNGEPVLIEANLHNGGINFHQMNNGPVFKEYIDYFLQITN